MRVPIRPLHGRWPAWLERRFARFFWSDPGVVLDKEATPEAFTKAMSAFLVGGTYKITGAARHPNVDSLLIDHVDLADTTILDVGASDGSTSMDLIRRLTDFRSYTIADKYLVVGAERTRRHKLFYDQDNSCVLIVGPRSVAWPSLSMLVRVMYWPLVARAARTQEQRENVLLVNPAVRALMAADKRVSVASHDVFKPWQGPRPDVIKVANLLRRLYFDDQTITLALDALLQSLADGGYLLIADNSRLKGVGPRAGLYRRVYGRFVLVAQTAAPPEIADLVVKSGPRQSCTDEAGRTVDDTPE